jgi:hypothetical protein
MFMEAYREICKNNNIPENWDEKDFEEEEIKHHITMAFTLAIRDLMSGQRGNQGTCEYFSQLGINFVVGYAMAARYVNAMSEAITADKAPSIDSEYLFLDEMYELFKNEYKRAVKRMGLDSVIHENFLYTELKTQI